MRWLTIALLVLSLGAAGCFFSLDGSLIYREAGSDARGDARPPDTNGADLPAVDQEAPDGPAEDAAAVEVGIDAGDL